MYVIVVVLIDIGDDDGGGMDYSSMNRRMHKDIFPKKSVIFSVTIINR